MKSKKTSKKKDTYYQTENTEIKIKKRRKEQGKKFNKHNIYSMIEEEDDSEIDLFGYLTE